MNLSEHLKQSIEPAKNEQVNESLILGAAIASIFLAQSVGPILNSNFMTSVGQGIGTLFAGVGSIFGFAGNIAGGIGGMGGTKADDIRELLDKDPDDLTGKEKELLKKAAKNKKFQKEFSNNELKKLSKLSGVEINNDKKETNDDTGDTGDTGETPAGWSESLLALAAAANKNEKDEGKKAENDALIDMISASCYDDNGNPVPPADREKRMKELVGEENWDDFKKDLEEKQKSVNQDDFKAELENIKKKMSSDDAEQMMKDQQERAKAANAKIKKEKADRQAIEDELAELEQNPEENQERINELKNQRNDLINKSTLGVASPNTAKAAIQRAGGGEPAGSTTGGEPDPDSEEAKAIQTYKDKEAALTEEYTRKMEGKSEEEVASLQAEWDEKAANLAKEREQKIEEAVEKDYKKKKDDLKAEYEQKKEGKTDEEKAALDEEYKNKKKEINDSQYDRIYKAKIDAKTAEYEQKQQALEASYNTQIEAAESDEDKERLREELKKEQRKLRNQEHKEKDEIDDKDAHTDEDETKEGKYTVKTEEITDPETGEKKTVKTYTGPRGGKFYYPDDNKSKNKVYVTESYNKKYFLLRNYLLESLTVEAEAAAKAPAAPKKDGKAEDADKDADKGSKKEKNKINIKDTKSIYKKAVDRLSYIKYLMDDKENADNKDKLQKIYDVLYDLTFNDGKLRSVKEMISHIKDLQKENNGKIPNLPSESILKSLDVKLIRFRDYDEDTFNKYVSKLEKTLNYDIEKSDKDSDSDQILNSEPSKKEDKPNKDMIVDLEMSEDANKGLCRALCLIDLTNGMSVDKSDIPDEEDIETDVDIDNSKKDTEKDTEKDKSDDIKLDTDASKEEGKENMKKFGSSILAKESYNNSITNFLTKKLQ